MATSTRCVSFGISAFHVLTSIASWFLIDFVSNDTNYEENWGVRQRVLNNVLYGIVICGFIETASFLYVSNKDPNWTILGIFRGPITGNLFIQFFVIGFFVADVLIHAKCILSHSPMKFFVLLVIFFFSLWSWLIIIFLLLIWLLSFCWRTSPSPRARNESRDGNPTATEAFYSIAYFFPVDPLTSLTTPLAINEESSSASTPSPHPNPSSTRGNSIDQAIVSTTSYTIV
jgi:hypothetical protein